MGKEKKKKIDTNIKETELLTKIEAMEEKLAWAEHKIDKLEEERWEVKPPKHINCKSFDLHCDVEDTCGNCGEFDNCESCGRHADFEGHELCTENGCLDFTKCGETCPNLSDEYSKEEESCCEGGELIDEISKTLNSRCKSERTLFEAKLNMINRVLKENHNDNSEAVMNFIREQGFSFNVGIAIAYLVEYHDSHNVETQFEMLYKAMRSLNHEMTDIVRFKFGIELDCVDCENSGDSCGKC